MSNPEPFPPSDHSLDPEVVATAQPLTNMEVMVLLDGFVNAQRLADPSYQSPQIVEQVQQHLKALVTGNPSSDICEQVRMRLLGAGFKEWEMVLMSNLLPTTPEEALAYIPSLQMRFTEEDLKAIIQDLERLTILC